METHEDPAARVVRAFALAPLVAPAVFAAALLLLSFVLSLFGAALPSVGATADLLLAVGAAGIPIAYGSAFVAGLPAYLLLRRRHAVRRPTLLCVGGIVGVLTALVLAPWLHGELFSIPFPWWAGLGLGVVTAEAFWRLLRGPGVR